jgi:Mg2+ and Co2+ transporter CorA
VEEWLVSQAGLVKATGSEAPLDGFTWVDVDAPDEAEIAGLKERFPLTDDVAADLVGRTMVPKVDHYPGGVEIVIHDLDEEGHLLELDMCIGADHLITVHGPLTEGVDLAKALATAQAEIGAIRDGKARPASPSELAGGIIGRICESLEHLIRVSAGKAGVLDRRLRAGQTGNPEAFLDELFSVRHDLVTIGNRAAQNREACVSAAEFLRTRAGQDGTVFDALAARFAHVRTLCDGEKEFQQGLVDYYEHLTATRMNIAMERLALITALALPVTAVASLYGMNIIVNYQTDVPHLIVLLGILFGVMAAMFVWARKHGWW